MDNNDRNSSAPFLFLESRTPAPSPSPAPKTSLRKQLSPLRYPGGKSRVIDQIAIHLSRDRLERFVEVFAGGASLGLSLLDAGWVKILELNEYDPLVFNFWNTVLSKPEALYDRLQGPLPTLGGYFLAKERVAGFEAGPICMRQRRILPRKCVERLRSRKNILGPSRRIRGSWWSCSRPSSSPAIRAESALLLLRLFRLTVRPLFPQTSSAELYGESVLHWQGGFSVLGCKDILLYIQYEKFCRIKSRIINICKEERLDSIFRKRAPRRLIWGLRKTRKMIPSGSVFQLPLGPAGCE